MYFAVINPVLKYGDQIITEDTTITHIGIETLTYELNNAGPPRAESLDMYTTYETILSGAVERNDTCSWNYRLEKILNDIGLTVRYFRFLLEFVVVSQK